MRNRAVVRLSLSGLFLALALLLPLLTGQIREIGNMLCPMHLPVLLCGFVCGWPYGLAVGFVAPLLRFALFGMPPIFPIGVAMAFELAVYGFVTGMLRMRLPGRAEYVYLSLVAAMLAGRAVWGVARLLLAGLSGTPFTLAMFVSGAITMAVPGIVAQLLLVPPLVLALEKVCPGATLS